MIIIGSDHAGFELKEKIRKKLILDGYDFIDVSPDYIENDDYTDVVERLCDSMTGSDKGVMVCGTGIGSAIMANKFRGIRATTCFDEYTAKMSRQHNNANVLCMGGRTSIAKEEKSWWSIIDTFIIEEFTKEERHVRRLNKIKEIERRGK